MNCDPNTLAEAAKCFQCLPRRLQQQVWIYLLCAWWQDQQQE